MREPVVVLDAELRVRLANDSFYSAFAVEPAETVGRRLDELGDGQWNIPELGQLLAEVVAHDTPFSGFEVSHHFERVGRKTMLLNARRLAQLGERRPSILLAIEDITDREAAAKATAHLAAIVTSSDDAILSKDLEGTITSWNRGASQLFGYTAEEAVGRSVTLLIPDDHLEEEPRILERIRGGETIGHYETVRRRKDGSLVDISLTVSPIRDVTGRIVGASKIARDISAPRSNQSRAPRLRSAQDRVPGHAGARAAQPAGPHPQRDRDRARSQTAGRDEKEGRPSGPRPKCSSARWLRWRGWSTIFSTSAGSPGERSSSAGSASSCNRSSSKPSRSLARWSKMGHELSVTVPPEPCSSHADPIRLAQVVGNLLNNACKFTRSGAASPSWPRREDDDAVDPRAGQRHRHRRRISWIASSTCSRRSTPRSSGRSGGLGIGLTLVKSLVEMHGGTVEARSDGLGRGSEFVVRLPLLGEAASRRRTDAAAASPTVTARRMLVVDDNQTRRNPSRCSCGSPVNEPTPPTTVSTRWRRRDGSIPTSSCSTSGCPNSTATKSAGASAIQSRAATMTPRRPDRLGTGGGSAALAGRPGSTRIWSSRWHPPRSTSC